MIRKAAALEKDPVSLTIFTFSLLFPPSSFSNPLAAGVLHCMGILLSPAMGAVLKSLSTVFVAINAKLLQVSK